MKCACVSMIACSLHDFRCELNALNITFVMSNYAARFAFAHCHIHVIFTVCCM